MTVPSLVRRLTRRIKYSHWVFRLPSFVQHRLQLQDGARRDLDLLAEATAKMAGTIQRLATTVRDLDARLGHHEHGPLERSRARYDAAQAHGVLSITPRLAPSNGQSGPPWPAPKLFDARGIVVDTPHPPPAEAVNDDEDDPHEEGLA